MKALSRINLALISGLLSLPSALYAQGELPVPETEATNPLTGAVVFLIICFALILLLVIVTPKYQYSYERRRKRFSPLIKLWNILNRGVPVEKEKDIMLNHEFDGIRELNNTIPPWFNILFYGTILFALVYLIDYHVLGSGNIMAEEYAQEIMDADKKREELIRTGAFINENTVTLLSDLPDIDKGKQIFTVNCSPCHGPDGGGTVGPNLTDEYWVHGGGIKNVFKTVKEGVPVKGMISWKTMLNPKQIQQVSSYILSLQGTKPVTGKPPEGNKWIETDSTKTGKDSLKLSENIPGKIK